MNGDLILNTEPDLILRELKIEKIALKLIFKTIVKNLGSYEAQGNDINALEHQEKEI